MKLEKLLTKREKLRFLKFREALYDGDKNYYVTEDFVLRSMLFEDSPGFVKRMKLLPLQVVDGEKIIAQAVIFFDALSNRISLGYFDALQNAQNAVDLIIDFVKKERYDTATEIVVGLNGHLSCGVGILTEGFNIPNSFDSLYNKSYYKDYFNNYEKVGLSTYRGDFFKINEKFTPFLTDKITVRKANLKDFKKEMELMRSLCDKTIGKTLLYEQTEVNHFFELTKDLKPFLKNENLLFALKDGKEIGFLFWHPDYNQMLKGGKSLSILEIGLRYVLKRKQIKTVKLNAIGALSPYATYALLSEFFNLTENRYAEVETNFIWDNNLKSSKIARKIFGKPDRKYEIYYIK